MSTPLPIYIRLVGDGQFDSEQLVGYELGYRSLFSRNIHVDVTGFYNQYDDLLSVEARPPFIEQELPSVRLILPLLLRNGVAGITKGIELSPVWEARPRLRLKGSYSFLHLSMTNKPGSVDASTVRQLEGDSPQHKLVVQSSFDLSKAFEFDLTYRYVSDLPDLKVQAYSTADARVGWHLSRQFELSFVGLNLFQPHHVEYAGDPGPLVGIKRSAYVKVTFTR